MPPVINLSAQEHGAQLQSGDGGLKTVIDVYSGQFGSRVSIFASKNDLFGTVLLHAQKQDPDIKYKLVSFCQSQQEIAMMYWACKQLVICSFSVSSRKTIFDEDTALYWHSVSSGFNVFQLRRKTPVLKVLKLHQLFSNSDWCWADQAHCVFVLFMSSLKWGWLLTVSYSCADYSEESVWLCIS